MRRALLAFLLLLPGLRASLLPEALGDFVRADLSPAQPDDSALFDEFGFQESETAVYQTPDGKRSEINATQFFDDTGAYAAYRWLLPAVGAPSEYGERSWTNDAGTLIHFGNYVIKVQGDLPEKDNIELMLAFLPRVRMTSDPPLLKFAPSENVVSGSEKYILGPVALEKVAPEIPPSAAGFHFGAEAQYAEYRTPAGPLRMVLFSYPTMQMARLQADELYKIDGVVAKRSGPMVAAVISPPSGDEAEMLLSKIRYEAEVTLDQTQLGRHDNIGTLIIDIFILCGILILFCVAGGILVAVARRFFGRVAPGSILAAPEGDGMIHLHLDNRN